MLRIKNPNKNSDEFLEAFKESKFYCGLDPLTAILVAKFVLALIQFWISINEVHPSMWSIQGEPGNIKDN